MTAFFPALFLVLLTPLTCPVSGGTETAFRFRQGLVPQDGWIMVSGIPFSSRETFAEVTFMGGSGKSLRVMSSGPTAGVHPSVGSQVTEDGYAGFLSVAGASVSLCDFGESSISASWMGFTLEHRKGSGVMGEFRSQPVLFAGDGNAFTAGVSPGIGENLRIGPTWCHDLLGDDLWLDASFSCGPFTLETGGALADGRAHRRASVAAVLENLTASAGYDEGDLFGNAGVDRRLMVEWPDWGASTVLTPSQKVLLALSHRQGGEFQGEVQVCLGGVTGGITLGRHHGGGYRYGLIVGLNLQAATSPSPYPGVSLPPE